MDEGLAEVVWGEINANLISQDSSRILAIIDQAWWRITRLALSASNMQMNGGMLDVVTERAHTRSFAIRPQSRPADPEKSYCIDYSDHATQMERLYRAVVRSVDRGRRACQLSRFGT